MGASYGQFCPVAKAMELLDERWTMLVIRELASGSQHFNELRRGVPRMSPTLLSRRLQQLVRAGIVRRLEDCDTVRYVLTPAGEELRPVVMALGAWGTRWIGELGDQDLDPRLLMWDMHRNVNDDVVPPGRTVVHFTFPDVPAKVRRWWMVITPGDVDICDYDPGHPVSVSITAELRQMIRLWRGDIGWSRALRSGLVEISGPGPLRRAVPEWFRLSPFAQVPRANG